MQAHTDTASDPVSLYLLGQILKNGGETVEETARQGYSVREMRRAAYLARVMANALEATANTTEED